MQLLYQMSPFKEGSVDVVRLARTKLLYFIYIRIYIYIYIYIKLHWFKIFCNISFVMYPPEDGYKFGRNMQKTCYVYNMIYDMIYLLTAVGLSPGGSSTVHIYTQTVHRTTQNKQYTEQHNNGRVRAVPRLGQIYPGICPTTEEKSRKNLSQGRKTSV